jgi:hypothetical protein
LLLSYVRQASSRLPLRITDLEVTVILAFLAHLERQRRNSVRSRNIRLAAIRSFFRLVALRDPESVGLATQVLAIPIKRCDKLLVGYLTQPEMEAILALWLGHEDVQTTHVYLQADLAMKEKALNKLAPPETKVARFKPCDEVLAFLASL